MPMCLLCVLTAEGGKGGGRRPRRRSKQGGGNKGEEKDGGPTPARKAVMAALAPALEEASAAAVLVRLDGDIRAVVEDFRGEAESLVSTLVVEEGGGAAGEGEPVVPELEAAARLTRECGACGVVGQWSRMRVSCPTFPLFLVPLTTHASTCNTRPKQSVRIATVWSWRRNAWGGCGPRGGRSGRKWLSTGRSACGRCGQCWRL